MNKHSMILSVVLITIFSFALGLISFAQEEAKAEEKAIEHIVAKVNNTIITSSEIQETILELKDVPQMRKLSLDEIRKQALETLITTKLVTSIADVLKMGSPDDLINRRIEEIKKENNITTDEELNDRLKSQGKSIHWLKQQLTKELDILKRGNR